MRRAEEAEGGQDMLLGIDVGGTYTDAVLVEGNQVIGSAKSPTTHGKLLAGMLGALDGVLHKAGSRRIERIALSTTLVTNAIVENKMYPVGVLVIPGPGMNITSLLPPHAYILAGSIDHRGREIAGVERAQVVDAMLHFRKEGIRFFAVIGKFSVRNPAQELQVTGWMKELCPEAECIALGHQLGSNLNFPRRIHTAYLNAAVWGIYQEFADAMEEALRQRHLTAPVFILKADGGTLSLAASRRRPVETVITGPAASILGARALGDITQPAVTLDIGGTTTDIALWRGGRPLFAAKGVHIGSSMTQVRSFLTRSIGLGGDSWIRREKGRYLIGPERKGLPAALGGPYPTITDALCVLGETCLGDKDKARQALGSLLPEVAEDIARQVLDTAAGYMADAVREMLDSWEQEPQYRVHDVLKLPQFGLRRIVGIGGGAKGLTQRVADKLGCTGVLPEGGAVANAIGAAVARSTLLLTLRVDTEQDKMIYVEEGRQTPVTLREVGEAAVIDAAKEHLAEKAVQAQFPIEEIDTVYTETFPVVRGHHRTGKLITAQVQLRPGILTKVLWKAGADSAE